MKRPSMTRLLAMTNVSPAAMARLAPACVGGIWHYNQLHNGRRINNGCYQLPRKVEEDVLKEGHIVIISWQDFEVSLPQWRAKTMTTFHKINTINKTQMQTITYVQYLKFIFTTQTCYRRNFKIVNTVSGVIGAGRLSCCLLTYIVI